MIISEKKILTDLLAQLDAQKKHLLIEQIFESNRLESSSVKEVFQAMYFLFTAVFFRKKVVVPKGVKNIFFELSDEQIENRKRFLTFHTKKSFFGFTLNTGKSVLSLKNVIKKTRIALPFLVLILRSIFFKSHINPKSYGKTIKIIFVVDELISKINPDKIYFFHTYFLPVSICSLYMSDKLPVFSISGNTPLAKWSPYKVYDHLIVCNLYQLEELEFLKKKKQIEFNNYTFYGNENQEVHDKYSHWKKAANTATYDIGIYTMGFWARKKGVQRINNFNQLACDPDFKNNEYDSHEKKMMDFVKQITAELNLNAIIYPHPYERQIFKQTSLKSYYSDIEKLPEFSINFEGGSSNQKFEDCKIGITTFSTVGFDRLNFNFNSIFYVKKNEFDLFDATIPSKWEENFVQNKDQLKKRIISLL